MDIDALWDFDNPAETEQRLRAALATVPASDPQHAELLTQIARTQGLQRLFDAAHRTLDQAAALLNDETVLGRIRLLLERGRVLNSSGQPEASREFFVDALALAKEHMDDDPTLDHFAVDAAHMMGIVAVDDDRMEWNLAALQMAEESADPRAQRWLGSLFNNIGWTYHDQGQHAQALNMFQRGLAWRTANRRGPHDDGGIRIARWSVARAERSLGQYDVALALQRALEADCAAAGAPDGYVFEELAECLLALGRTADAAPYFTRAHELLSADPWLVANEAPRLARLAHLGGR